METADLMSMNKLLRYLSSIDVKVTIVSLICVGTFLISIYFVDFHKWMGRFTQMVSSSASQVINPEMYCNKSENRGTSFCDDRRAAVNNKWREVGTSGSSKNKTAFSFRK